MNETPDTPLDPSTGDARDVSRRLRQATADTRALTFEMDRSALAGLRFGASFGRALDGLVFKGKSLGDTIRSLGLSLSQLAVRAAFKPLEAGIDTILSGFLKTAITTTSAPGAAPALPVSPFAKGGVIAAPMSFPLGRGVGIAGEAGAEAIMPLARGPDGRLGVAASGATGMHITFNVTAADADSFRRSEAQIAAMLARAASAGHRNL